MRRFLTALGISVSAIMMGWAERPSSFRPITEADLRQVQDETNTQNEAKINEYKIDEKQAYMNVEEQAEFPGGLQGLMEWLGKTIKYPRKAQKNKVEGKVVVLFIIEKDGSISDVKIIESIDPDLDKEALRIVKKMPKWKPGKLNGDPVRSYFTLPINFRLQQKTSVFV